MAKDALGHGSDGRDKRNSFTHEQHYAKSQALMKQRTEAMRSGNTDRAAMLMARAKDHADQAMHLMRAQKTGSKVVGFGTPGLRRMSKGSGK